MGASARALPDPMRTREMTGLWLLLATSTLQEPQRSPSSGGIVPQLLCSRFQVCKVKLKN